MRVSAPTPAFAVAYAGRIGSPWEVLAAELDVDNRSAAPRKEIGNVRAA